MAGSSLSAPREMRARWYLQIDKYHKPVGEVCNIFGISRKTYYKWRLKDFGPNAHDYYPRAIHPDSKLTPNIKTFMVREKLAYNYGPKKMKIRVRQIFHVIVSTTTIYKFYKKKRLIRKPQKKQAWYMPLKHPYRARRPGRNVQLDVKYVPGPYASWSYQYRFIDTVTNMQFAVESTIRDAEATIHVFRSAIRFFPFKITGIQTDNGGEFRGLFHEYLIRNKIIHRYIPKRSAPWNGKVERANRSIDDEYYLNRTKPWHTLEDYTKWYNEERPHLGRNMNGITPYEKYLSLAG